MTETKTSPPSPTLTADRLRIDFLYLDLTTCDRCRSTDRNLETALDAVLDVLEASGPAV